MAPTSWMGPFLTDGGLFLTDGGLNDPQWLTTSRHKTGNRCLYTAELTTATQCHTGDMMVPHQRHGAAPTVPRQQHATETAVEPVVTAKKNRIQCNGKKNRTRCNGKNSGERQPQYQRAESLIDPQPAVYRPMVGPHMPVSIAAS